MPRSTSITPIQTLPFKINLFQSPSHFPQINMFTFLGLINIFYMHFFRQILFTSPSNIPYSTPFTFHPTTPQTTTILNIGKMFTPIVFYTDHHLLVSTYIARLVVEGVERSTTIKSKGCKHLLI